MSALDRDRAGATRPHAALAGLCLALAMAQGAARADAADTGAHTPPAETAPESDGGAARPVGLLSRIVEWFRSDDAAASPAPAQHATEAMRDPAAEPATLGDVHAAVRDAIAEIALLRTATGVAPALPRESAVPREDLAPAHVHARALEVLAKTARAQRRLGMIAADASRAPVTGFAPDDLHRTVRGIVVELRRIKRQLVVETAIAPAQAHAGAATPGLDAELAHASALLDGLVGRPPTLNDVRAGVARIHDELRAVAAGLDVALASDAPAEASAQRAPGEVAQQLLRAAYKAIGLQTALGMEASGVPGVALEGATPTDALAATTVVLGEVLRIRAHLGAGPLPPAARPDPGDAPQAAEVYASARSIVAHLDAIMRAAGDAR